MDVRFNEDQIEIARQARKFFEKECPIARVRELFEDEEGFSREIWQKMAELGWMGMHIPEAYGGLGMDFTYQTVLLEEMGRALLPGPFFSTVALAAESILEAGTDEQKEHYLPGIAGGELRGTVALIEPDGGADLGYIKMAVRVDGSNYVLNGTKLCVPDAHLANFVICTARTLDADVPIQGVTLFLVPLPADGVVITPLPVMDGTRKLSVMTFTDVRVGSDSLMGKLHDGWLPLSRALQRAQVGLAAESVGVGQRAMEIAADYAKIRVQFDQPIGGYQAIKHRCARMFEQVESARSLLYWAAWAQDHEEPHEAAIAASAAKAYCSEVAEDVCAGAVQVLGGTGFSWEHDIHLYLKRAKANEVALGDPVYHREHVALLIAG
ncbi:MAG: acyl-CoA/acyl-ACP dehydrogenase [Desulfomonile sp.]|nr:acyl-CoA/acyl-ACP dehydrogenase [Desulfomonile sp.]